PELVTIKGEIRFSDDVEQALVQKAFSAKTNDNQSLTPVIESTADTKIFRFIIEDIHRKKTDIDLEIKIDGKAVGIGKTISQNVTIPALDVFKVISTEQIFEPENGIQIVFTDPVSQSQDLRGLISVSGVSNFTFHAQNNKINIYFDRKGVNEVTITVDQGIKNTKGENLESPFSTTITIEKLKPQVELLSNGNIIPSSDNLQLPFKAVNLYAVDIKVIKIYENNVLMFLQNNTLNGSNELRRSGRLVYKKTLRLDGGTSKNIHNWQNYSIDLSQMVRQEPGAIYRIEFSFKQAYSAYPCGGEETDVIPQSTSEELTRTVAEGITEEEEALWDSPYPYYSDGNYDWSVYEWEERDNPCHPTYYMLSERRVSCNVMMSDIGVIAKANSDNQWWIAVSNLLDTKPVANANITLYNYQLQPIGTVKSDADGFATIAPKSKPFVLIAEANGQKTYLRLVEGEENSLSRFDVGGKTIEKGLKGFIYGERGVWRPGDTLHISFILYDPEKRIPENHPVTFEMYNPRGQFHSKQILTNSVNGFYTYAIPTQADDPTGLWNAYVKIGGTSFHKSLRIETIKPNRLKINLTLPGDRLNASAGTIPATLSSAWLTGATAHNLKAKVEMTLTKTNTQFKEYDKYIFNNPATDFSSNQSDVFEGTLNDAGEVKFNFKVPKAENAPGMLNANIVCRVFEPGGDASIYTQAVPFSPFPSYVGLNLNQEKDKYIETDTDHRFDIVTLNADGKPVNRSNLEYKIYRIGWSWWWEHNDESFASYVNSSSYQPVAQGKLQTVNGKASFTFKLKYPDWGRYLVYVTDKESGHAAGGTVYIDWPEWRGRSSKSDPDNIKMLTFSTDKTSYEIGEDITVIIPAATNGNALLALENGSSILSRTWVAVSDKGDTKYTFKATKEMAPNFYVHISLLQPHAQTLNDLPIRMYGVIPVMISNKESVLEPQINLPEVLRPETEFTVEVSEK
ncbi:MAG: alpha-2-macroglobulin, partial [Candidatus Symbiothrix sp.]|nr:alpha-2-macroglobulin [Candidatus Symbiothrix sp.]